MTNLFYQQDVIDQAKIEAIVDNHLQWGNINSLDQLYSLIDNLIVNDDLNTYTTYGEKKLIESVKVNEIDSNEIVITLQDDDAESMDVTIDYTIENVYDELYDLGIDWEYNDEHKKIIKDLINY